MKEEDISDEMASGSEDEVFTIEKVLACRGTGEDQEFNVKWEGYGDTDNTWESRDTIKSCPNGKEALKTFEKERGLGKYADKKPNVEDLIVPPAKKVRRGSTSSIISKASSEASTSATKPAKATGSLSVLGKSPVKDMAGRKEGILNEIKEHTTKKIPYAYQLGWIGTKIDETISINEEAYLLVNFRDPHGKEEDIVEWMPDRLAHLFCQDAVLAYYEAVLEDIKKKEIELGISENDGGLVKVKTEK